MARVATITAWEHASAVVAVGAVSLSCFLIGGVHARSQVLLCGLAAIAFVLNVAMRARRRRPLGIPLLSLPLVVGFLLSVLSLMPLPRGVRSVLSPTSVDHLDRLASLLPGDDALNLAPVLAFDPPETALAVVRLVFGFLVLVVVADRSRHRDGRALLWRMLLATAFAVGLATIFAYAVGSARWSEAWGIVVNPNHRARVLGTLGLLSLGRALTLRPRVEAAWFAVGGGLCTLLVPVTTSRGGVVALVVGLFTLALWLRPSAETSGAPAPHSLRRRLIVGGIGVLALTGTAVVVTGEERFFAMAEETLEHPERVKTFLWEPSLRLAAQEPLVGVGNNGFGVAFPAVLAPGELDATLTYTHAENVVLQTLADHGLVGGFFVLFAALVVFVTLVRQLQTPTEKSALPALVFLVVGDVVDFVLEIPVGIGLAAVTLGLCAGRLGARETATYSLGPVRAAVLAVVVVCIAASCARSGLFRSRAVVDEWLEAMPASERRAALYSAIAAHPADATYATDLAIEARRRRDPRGALAWANRALVVWPAFPAAHREAARALAVGGRLEQAMLEYREAARAQLDKAWLKEVTRRTPDPALRRRAFPEPMPAIALAMLCEVYVEEKRPDISRDCFAELTDHAEASVPQVQRAIAVLLEVGDVDAAARGWSKLARDDAHPDGPTAALGAELVAAQDGEEKALAVSLEWLSQARDPWPLLEWRLGMLRNRGDFADAARVVERMLPLASTTKDRRRLEKAMLAVLEGLGDGQRSLDLLERALLRDPRNVVLLGQKALAENGLGLDAAARATLERLRAIAPQHRATLEVERKLFPRR
jgi:O-antigen ligase/tetratricopeptide (TPR) repeat protein